MFILCMFNPFLFLFCRVHFFLLLFQEPRLFFHLDSPSRACFLQDRMHFLMVAYTVPHNVLGNEKHFLWSFTERYKLHDIFIQWVGTIPVITHLYNFRLFITLKKK